MGNADDSACKCVVSADCISAQRSENPGGDDNCAADCSTVVLMSGGIGDYENINLDGERRVSLMRSCSGVRENE